MLVTVDLMYVLGYRELFPSSRCLFMYRDVEKVAKSSYRSSLCVPSGYLILQALKLSPMVTKLMMGSMGLHADNFAISLPGMPGDLVFGTLVAIVTTTLYLKARRNGVDVRAVCYEDLVARPRDMCRVILEFCHLPVSLTDLAVKAFDVDSQRNSHIAKSVIGHFKDPEMTPQAKVKLNEILKKFEMPPIGGEPNILEGTLTCS